MSLTDALKRAHHEPMTTPDFDIPLSSDRPKCVSGTPMPTVSLAESYLSVGGDTEPQETRDAMNDDRYRKIFDDFGRDLFAVAKKHGKRALREAVRDAANGNLLQEDNLPPEEVKYPDEGVLVILVSSDAEEEIGEKEKEQTTEEESADEPEDIPPEDLEYPDEDVWTVPPAPEDDEEDGSAEDGEEEEQSADEGHELSDAAERVLDRLMDRLMDKLEKRAGK
jgi:hypothetical protein